MRILSLFDGMSCGQIALNRAGVSYSEYFASEIDPYAIRVAQHNYPATIQLGDVRGVKAESLPKIDLLIGGSPCQGFSFAGKGLNFEDPRSKLFFEFVRLLKECRPKYFLLENVLMKKEHEKVISGYLGVEPVFINSALVSAQNRKRLYWTNIPFEDIEDYNVTWGNVRERGVNTTSYYYTGAAMQWLARVSQKKNKVLTVHGDTDKMQMLEAGHHKKYSNQRFFGIVDLPDDSQAVAAMRGRYAEATPTGKTTKQFIEFRYDNKTNALTTVSKDNIVVPFTLPNSVPADEFFFRYITPKECERLQTVPDNYTACVSNTQRYKMLGNGWTVDVIAHIFQSLKDNFLNENSYLL